jgi:hypothetical protein
MIEKRRDELLAKAAELFQKKGYHATTMKDIAAELQYDNLCHLRDGELAVYLVSSDRKSYTNSN